MGQQQPNYEALLSHSPNEWFKIGSHHSYEILRNKATHQLAEEYIIPIDTANSLQKHLEIYEYRRLQNDNLVCVIELQKLQNKNICAPMLALKVITERMPHRLSDIATLTLPQALYIIKQCLLGFRVIYQNDGPLIIDEDMIGFNSNNKVKVWLNSNFGSNSRTLLNRKLLDKESSKNSYQSQVSMSQTIISLVLMKLDREQQSRMKVKTKNLHGFFSCLNFIDDYCQDQGIKLAVSVSQRCFQKQIQGKECRSKYVRSPRVLECEPRVPKLQLKRIGSLDRMIEPFSKRYLQSSRSKTKESRSSNTSFYRQNNSPYFPQTLLGQTESKSIFQSVEPSLKEKRELPKPPLQYKLLH